MAVAVTGWTSSSQGASWAEVQADSFSFECRGCTKMKELEVQLEGLRLLGVAMVGREQGGCASSSGGGTVDDKVGKYMIDARESSPQPGRKLGGGNVTGRMETGRKETGRKGTREDNRSEGEGSGGDRREGEGSGGDVRENNRSEGEGSGGRQERRRGKWGRQEGRGQDRM